MFTRDRDAALLPSLSVPSLRGCRRAPHHPGGSVPPSTHTHPVALSASSRPGEWGPRGACWCSGVGGQGRTGATRARPPAAAARRGGPESCRPEAARSLAKDSVKDLLRFPREAVRRRGSRAPRASLAAPAPSPSPPHSSSSCCCSSCSSRPGAKGFCCFSLLSPRRGARCREARAEARGWGGRRPPSHPPAPAARRRVPFPAGGRWRLSRAARLAPCSESLSSHRPIWGETGSGYVPSHFFFFCFHPLLFFLSFSISLHYAPLLPSPFLLHRGSSAAMRLVPGERL